MTGPLHGPLAPLAAAIYGLAIARRNRAFDRGRGVVTLDLPVLSVGNLSVGGTGKTPLVAHLIRVLREAGRRPCVAMRGYKARAGESDEAREYQDRFPDLPLVARPDRVEGLLELFASPEGERVDCVILDDGFQHRRLARQFDIALIDATRPPSTDRLLPAGWLREPAANLARAHAVVITHAERSDPAQLAALRRDIAAAAPRALIAACAHAWRCVTIGGVEHPSAWLRAKRLVAACAIGNPAPFLAAAAAAAGAPLAATLALPDHDPFAPTTIARLIALLREHRADALLITAKDWSKLQRVPAAAWPCPVAVAALELRFQENQPAFEQAAIHAAELRVE